jgi:hypothetical protein
MVITFYLWVAFIFTFVNLFHWFINMYSLEDDTIAKKKDTSITGNFLFNHVKIKVPQV